jgi:hypothetical protein
MDARKLIYEAKKVPKSFLAVLVFFWSKISKDQIWKAEYYFLLCLEDHKAGVCISEVSSAQQYT